MKYIVNFSTGLSSFESLRRTLEQKGRENTIAVFADVQGDPGRDPHAAPVGTNWDGEDEDNYRFLADVEKLLDFPIQRLRHPDGLGVWGVIFRERAIIIRGQAKTFAPCTTILKMESMDEYVAKIRYPYHWPDWLRWQKSKAALLKSGAITEEGIREYEGENWTQKLADEVVQVLGLGWLEDDRVADARKCIGADVWFPMTEPPYVDNCHITAYLQERGVEPPRSYNAGFPHANCGGACIKAGIAQWAALLEWNPDRYLYNEEQEAWFRRDINPDVAILRDRTGGTTKALPLSELRRRLEAGTATIDPHDWGGCGCFAPSPQMRMADLILEVRASDRALDLASCD